MKVCTKCKIEKEYSEFGISKARKDGFYGQCKVCRKTYLDNWKEKNQSQIVSKDEKTCSKCKETKKNYEFGLESGTKDGLKATCRKCRQNIKVNLNRHRLSGKDYLNMVAVCELCGPVIMKRQERGGVCENQRSESRKNSYKNSSKAHTYKSEAGTVFLSQTERLQLIESYGNVCYICSATEDLHLDHCHTTGKFRGALCQKCNAAIGLLKEDKNRLLKAIEYLERY